MVIASKDGHWGRKEKKQQLNLVYLFVVLWGGISQSFWDHVASQVELNYDLAEKLAPIMLNIK